MDQQGNPIPASSGGTKVKSIPAPPIQEKPGPIASDSLAAESYRTHGDFTKNPDSHPLDVKGSSSTFANDDTSGAKVLPPAPDAEARESQEAWSDEKAIGETGGLKYPEGTGGPPKFPGAHDKFGYVGGPEKDRKEMEKGNKHAGEYETGLGNRSGGGGGGGSGSGEQHTGGEQYRARANVEPAPSYVANVTGDALDKGIMKPKGRNITEGGFDADDDTKNASWTGEVGTENDPGREAELRFERENAEPAIDAGFPGPRQKGIESRGVGYENLGTDEQA